MSLTGPSRTKFLPAPLGGTWHSMSLVSPTKLRPWLLLRATPVMTSLTVFWKTSPSNISQRNSQAQVLLRPHLPRAVAFLWQQYKLPCMKITQVVASLWEIVSRTLETSLVVQSAAQKHASFPHLVKPHLCEYSCVSTICSVSVILQRFLLSTLHKLPFQICPQLQISPKRTHSLIVSASYITVSLACNSVPLESNYPLCKTTKQIFYNSTGCAPGTKKLKAECLPKISEDHRQTLQQLMHLKKSVLTALFHVKTRGIACFLISPTADTRNVFKQRYDDKI